MATSGLGSLLVKEGLLTENDRRTISESSGQGSAAFAKGVLALGLLDEDELATFIATRTQFPLASRNLSSEASADAGAVLATHLLEFLEVVPLKCDERSVTIAMVDPLDREVTHQVEFFAGRKVRPVIATWTQIQERLRAINPKYQPAPSPLEEFLANHAESAGRRLGIVASPVEGDLEEDFMGEAPEEDLPETTAAHQEEESLTSGAAEVSESDDPFAQMDEGGSEFGDPPLPEIEESVVVSESSELSTTTEVAAEGEEVSEPAAEGVEQRALAEAGQQEEAALAQELGLSEADLAPVEVAGSVPDSVVGSPDGAVSAEQAQAGAEAALALDADMELAPAETSVAPEVEAAAVDSMEVAETPIEELSAEPLADIDESAMVEGLAAEDTAIEELGTPAAEEQAVSGEPSIETSEELSPDVAVEASPTADVLAEDAVTEEGGDRSLEVAPLEEESTLKEQEPAEVSAERKLRNDFDIARSAASINKALLAVQLSSNVEKAFAETARGLAQAGFVPGILCGRRATGEKIVVTWSGAPGQVEIQQTQAGQIDTSAVDELSDASTSGAVSSLPHEINVLGLSLAPGKGYIVPFSVDSQVKFVAAFEGHENFSTAGGLKATVVELLKRLVPRV